MTFTEWLKTTGTTQEEAAAQVGVSQGQISRIAKNGTTVLEIALRIRDMSGGLVSVDELRPTESEAA